MRSARQAEFDRARGGIQRGTDQRFAQHAAGFPGFGALRVLVHQRGGQRLVERAPVDADAHRLVVLDRELDQLRELGVALAAEADIAGIDAVLRQRLARRPARWPAAGGRCSGSRRSSARRCPSSRSFSTMRGTAAADSGLLTVTRTSSEPARHSSATCFDGRGDVGGVGVGHRLHHHRCVAADQDVADAHLAASAGAARGRTTSLRAADEGVAGGGSAFMAAF